MCHIGCVRFAGYCGQMYRRHLFSYGGLAGLTGNIKMFCIVLTLVDSVSSYFSSLTGIIMTLIAVERWLHMSRRSLLIVRRVVILYVTFVVCLIPFDACYIYSLYTENTSLVRASFFFLVSSSTLS